MIWVYLIAAMFGGAFLIPMVLGGLELDTDVDFDLDADVDLDLGSTDLDTDGGGFDGADAESALGAIVGGLFSFRSVVFFLAFFGASGAVFTWLNTNVVIALVTAALVGLFAAVLNSWLFTYLKNSGSSSLQLARDIEGSSARVVLPISKTQKGRIRTDIGGQPTFLVATPFAGSDTFDVGDSVVVVEMHQGTARVARLELDLAEQIEEK